MRLILALLLLAAAVPAAAQAPAPSAAPPAAVADPAARAAGREVVRACRTDIGAYCAKVEPGGGRFLQCFRQNWDKLSPACQATLKAMRPAPPVPGAG